MPMQSALTDTEGARRGHDGDRTGWLNEHCLKAEACRLSEGVFDKGLLANIMSWTGRSAAAAISDKKGCAVPIRPAFRWAADLREAHTNGR